MKGANGQIKAKSAAKSVTGGAKSTASKAAVAKTNVAKGKGKATKTNATKAQVTKTHVTKTAAKTKAAPKVAVAVKPKAAALKPASAAKAKRPDTQTVAVKAGKTSEAPTKSKVSTSPATKAKMPTKTVSDQGAKRPKTPASAPMVDQKATTARPEMPATAASSSDATVPTPAVRARTAETKSVAAALLAARRKAPPVAPASNPTAKTNDGVLTVKGVVEVADKNVQKAVVENEAPVAPVQPATPAPVAAVPGMNRRPGFPPRFGTPATAGAKIAAKPGSKHQGFKTNEFIVYPAHGVGEIVAIEEQEVAGYKLELFVISFVKDKMILKVPLPKIASVGMRKLAEAPVVKRALDTLTGRARIKRTMWSRRAQEYEAKINSGDLVAIAEVVRDLYRSDAQPEQSYSERQLYEAALDRMAREISVVQALTDTEALKVIDEQLRKGPRRGKTEESETEEADEAEDVEGNIGEAA